MPVGTVRLFFHQRIGIYSATFYFNGWLVDGGKITLKDFVQKSKVNISIGKKLVKNTYPL